MLHAGANAKADTGAPDLAGYSHVLLQNEIPLADTLAYMRAAGKLGLTTVYNPSPMPRVDELRAFPWDCLRFLIVNEGELEAILDAYEDVPVDAALSVADASVVRMKALHAAKGFNPDIVIVTTIGPDGVLALVPGMEIQSFPAVPATKVVDTTGAGDTFAGYFTAMLMEKGDDAPLKDIFPTCITVSRTGALGAYTDALTGVDPRRREPRRDGEHPRPQGRRRPRRDALSRTTQSRDGARFGTVQPNVTHQEQEFRESRNESITRLVESAMAGTYVGAEMLRVATTAIRTRPTK